jgi:hypothetical protein
MFCRFCGVPILADSRFCSKCGKHLADGSPRSDAIVRRLYLKTPYPYAVVVFLMFVAWAIQPDRPPFDYSDIRLELELVGKSEVGESNLYRHHFSLIVENIGNDLINDVPVEIRAHVEPDQPVEVETDFLGRRLVIMRDGDPFPLVVILQDEVEVSEKRRYSIDGIATSVPPFSITYEFLAENSDQVLASFTELVRSRDDDSEEPVSAAANSDAPDRP